MSIFYEIECNIYMCNLFYVSINLSRCTVIPNYKQIGFYVIVRAHKLESFQSFHTEKLNEMIPTHLQL